MDDGGIVRAPGRTSISGVSAKTCLTAFDAMLLGGLMLLVFQMLGPVLSIPLHLPLNAYNEGWNAVLDNRAVNPGAGPLYPPPDSFVFNNYPPLGFYLVGWLGKFVFGDMIVAGRVAGLLALLGSAGLTGLCATYLGARRRAGLAAGLLMLLFANSYYKAYVAVDDPQWLAHAAMLCGLAVLLRAQSPAGAGTPAATVIAAALLMVAGGFIKHSLVALPASVAVWLACTDRRAAVLWVAAGAAWLAAGLALTAALHGHAAFADVLQHRRVFRLNLMKQAIPALAPLLPMALAAGAALRLVWRRTAADRPGVLFVAIFGACALVTGIVQRTGEGVYYNAHFETLIAVCLAFGLALPAAAPAWRWRGFRAGPAALCLFAALPLICAWPWHLPRAWGDIHDRSARAASWQPVIDRIAATNGPAGCLMMALCWWAGKPSEVDMFNLTEKSVVAGEAPPAFRRAVAGRHFAIFEDDRKSFIHRDAIRKLGRDPVMPLFAPSYAPVLQGPEGVVLLAPLAAPAGGRAQDTVPAR